MSYLPSVLDEVRLKDDVQMVSDCIPGDSAKDGVNVIVKWCKEIHTEGNCYFEVGCQVKDSNTNLQETVNNWNLN